VAVSIGAGSEAALEEIYHDQSEVRLESPEG